MSMVRIPSPMRRIALAASAAAAFAAPALAKAPERSDRLPEDEIVYFLMPDRFADGDASNDRGGLTGGPLQTGFDPTRANFHLGGDLKGVREGLDYIQGLGATAIWLTPIFTNKTVQTSPHGSGTGFHGYWITDFTSVDPHFGTKADFKALVDAAHARGLKVYMDIVVNHTADVIKYRECHDPDYAGPDKVGPACPYRSKADYPYTRRGGVSGRPINDGFQGDDLQTAGNFATLTRPDWAYTPYIPAGEEHAKTPDWLNDPIYYHNRGNTTFEGENSTYGDFFGLDDLMTEHPRVVAGMIEIYEHWITDFHVDGFRIDTARHVDDAFWRQFIPAILAHAKAQGIPDFRIFGEAYLTEPGPLARMTWAAGFPETLDFAFEESASQVLSGKEGTDRLARMYAQDPIYRGGTETARRLPTFLGNHDQGRFAWRIRHLEPAMGDAELLERVRLGHALMMFARGTPVVYAGDEQGFVGLGDDNDARQPLFASRVARYNGQALLGTTNTTAVDNHDPSHPLYRAIAEMAAVRQAHAALRRGEMIVRLSDSKPGLFAFSRLDPKSGEEVVVALNTATVPITARTEVESGHRAWRPLIGACPSGVAAPGSLELSVPALDYVVCASKPEGGSR